MRRCRRCIMPETVPNISFNNEGICNYCQAYRKPDLLGKPALDHIIEQTRTGNNRYDCIVPLSGGRDSTYVLYLAKRFYNLKVLAVNYDNEFRTDIAQRNMKQACTALSIDFVSIRSKRNLARKVTRCNMLSSDLTRLFGVCRACTYGYTAVVYRAAEEFGVPLIIWGDSEQEKTKDLVKKASKRLKRRTARLKRLFKPDHYRYEYYFLQLRKELSVPGNWFFLKRPQLKRAGTKEVHLFSYIRWERKEIKSTIINELGWQKPPNSVSTWRTDCLLTPVVDYCFHKLYGCSKACFGYCNMINDGQMSREEALQQEEEILRRVGNNGTIAGILENHIGIPSGKSQRILSS